MNSGKPQSPRPPVGADSHDSVTAATRPRADDPRYQRVRGRLVEAIFELAGSRPAETVGVSELTSAAGVSRAAFYGHAASPAALLSDALIAELRPSLDVLAEQMSHPGVDYIGLWRQIYLTLLDHVRTHRAVYEVITARESAVSSALTTYFEEAATMYVMDIVDQIEGPPMTALWVVMAINQQAHNMLAVIRSWILTGLADPPETVVDTYLTLAPPWQLARPDDRGRISLHRALRGHDGVAR